MNCAVCHVSTVGVEDEATATAIYGEELTYAESSETDPESNRTKRAIVLGMPANTVDLEAYFTFLFALPKIHDSTLELSWRR